VFEENLQIEEGLFLLQRCKMKGIFWNSRGLSDLAKTRFLRETSEEQDLAFIALLETGKKDFSQDTLDIFSGGRNFV
jgi:hypothetical protein